MKKLYIIIAGLMLTVNVFAQAPEKMSYQAVVRNVNNELVTSTTVGMQISIIQGSVTGNTVYVETQNPTTNTNGLVSLEIGSGTIVSGDFATIDWANGTYFIKTETDPTGGTSYTITGTTQLMSVPYALHAKTAESISGAVNYTETDPVFGASVANGITAVDTANWNNHTVVTAGTNVTLTGAGTTLNPYVVNATSGSSGHYVGELFGGGIVFYVYNNGANGLIASLDDLDDGNGVAWSANTNTLIGVTAQSMTDGAINTAAMVAQDGTPNKAATLCDSYAGGGFTDWYLPSCRELTLLASQDLLIDQILDNDGDPATNGFSQNSVAPTYGRYWSSVEGGISFVAWYYSFNFGSTDSNNKFNTYRVRAIRAF